MSTDNKNTDAALIEAYCRDWQETAEPWKRWQVEMAPGEWAPLIDHPIWSEPYKYRRTPNTVIVNGIEVNAPLKVAPPLGTVYWLAVVLLPEITWRNNTLDLTRLGEGLVCATREDAEALWAAMTAPLRAYVGGGK